MSRKYLAGLVLCAVITSTVTVMVDHTYARNQVVAELQRERAQDRSDQDEAKRWLLSPSQMKK